MKFMKKFGGAILVISLLVGWKLYNKSSDAAEVKVALVGICADDTACVEAVNKHFDTCFDKAYDLGGRHRSASLDGSQLTACINQHAGSNYFAYAR
jgi:hypothetical protein